MLKNEASKDIEVMLNRHIPAVKNKRFLDSLFSLLVIK